MLRNIFCGVIAGSVSSAIANPTDVLKVRMQACSTSLQQKKMFECFRDIFQQEGLSGLWRVNSFQFDRFSILYFIIQNLL